MEGIETGVVWGRSGFALWRLALACWSGSFRLITSKTAEPTAFARSTVRRLKFADRTFSAKRRERFADRPGSSRGITNAAPGIP